MKRWVLCVLLFACGENPVAPIDEDPLDSVGPTYAPASWNTGSEVLNGFWIWNFEDGKTNVKRITLAGVSDVKWNGTYI